MGALSSSDSGISSSNIQNKIGLPAPISQTTLSPEELLHQQKVLNNEWTMHLETDERHINHFLKFQWILSSIVKYQKGTLQVQEYVSKLTPEQVQLQQTMVQVAKTYPS